MFQLSLPQSELKAFVCKQIKTFFPDEQAFENEKMFGRAFCEALERVEYCFKPVALKAYNDKSNTCFSHLHADQYTVFLWFLSNSVWKIWQNEIMASKIFYLNKILNGFTCIYDVNLPDIFLVLHGTGCVLGKARYSNYFVCCHGVTVGAVHGEYPTIGEAVAMAPHSILVGNCVIGKHVTLGTHVHVRNRNIADHLLYYKDSETGISKTKMVSYSWAQSFYSRPIAVE